MIPKYESITGSPQIVAPLSYEESDAKITYFFYNSNEYEKNEYVEYLLNNGWTKTGTAVGGDSRGQSEQIAFSFKDSDGNSIAKLAISFFPECSAVDLICVLKR